MEVTSNYIRSFNCFNREWGGLEDLKLVTVIIGRNNTGKSRLLDFAELLCGEDCYSKWKNYNFRCVGAMTPKDAEEWFHGELHPHIREMLNHDTIEAGKQLIGIPLSWQLKHGRVVNVKFANDEVPGGLANKGPDFIKALFQVVTANVQESTNLLSGKTFIRLLSDRDIRPELPSTDMTLGENGDGATNIIRRHLHSPLPNIFRRRVMKDLLEALNSIFGSDGTFTEILTQHHEYNNESGDSVLEGRYEIYLNEGKKGFVPLSQSGSGLKTVLLVLVNLLLMPKVRSRALGGSKALHNFVFAFEELENNLHPTVLRRLLRYIEGFAIKNNSMVFLTTHSSVALDLFGKSEHAQIIHVTHDGSSATTTTVPSHLEHLGVISELGAKPSDLLQANGIVWVEGPSDCVYLNRWIELASNGRLRAGRDFQCAFYNGSTLANIQFSSPDKEEENLVNLFRINPNVIVVCDGDQENVDAPLKERVRRVAIELQEVGQLCWITAAREIENYLPGKILSEVTGEPDLPDPEQGERFCPGTKDASYWETKVKRMSLVKTDLAFKCVPLMKLESMKDRFEWKAKMDEIVARIDLWNR